VAEDITDTSDTDEECADEVTHALTNLIRDITTSIEAGPVIPGGNSTYAAWGLFQIFTVAGYLPSTKVPEQVMEAANPFSDHLRKTRGNLKEQFEEIETLNSQIKDLQTKMEKQSAEVQGLELKVV